MSRRVSVPVFATALLACALATAPAVVHADGPPAGGEPGVLGGAARGLPALRGAELDAARRHLGIDARGRMQGGRVGAVHKALVDGGANSAEAARSALQAILGVPRLTAPIGAKTALVAEGRWLGEMSDVAPIPGKPGAVRAGSVWQAWTTGSADINPERKRPNNRAWRGPERAPEGFQLRSLPTDWRGLFSATSRDGLENGMSRGHVVPNASATASQDDQLRTFQLYANAFPQTRDSNAGAWRNLEKTIQDLAASNEYVVYNYAGVLWKPFEYRRLDGSRATVEPEMLHGSIPKPSAYWRVALVVPKKGPGGEPWDLAQGLAHARPLAAVIPNAQDADVFVSSWTRYSKSVAEVEKLAGLRLFTNLEGLPHGQQLVRALRSHRDDGRGLPREVELPAWKVAQLRQLVGNSSVSPEAKRAAQAMLREARPSRPARPSVERPVTTARRRPAAASQTRFLRARLRRASSAQRAKKRNRAPGARRVAREEQLARGRRPARTRPQRARR